MSDLDVLIKNIEDITSGRIWKRKEIKKMIFMCYKAILYDVALLQVYDTGTARALIVKVFCEKFGLETVDLQDLHHNTGTFWKDWYSRNDDDDTKFDWDGKMWDNAKEGDGVEIISSSLNVNMIFTHDRITNQANGETKQFYENGKLRTVSISPSEFNPNIEPQMREHHIDFVIDKANIGTLTGLNDMIDRLCDRIAEEIVKGLGV